MAIKFNKPVDKFNVFDHSFIQLKYSYLDDIFLPK